MGRSSNSLPPWKAVSFRLFASGSCFDLLPCPEHVTCQVAIARVCFDIQQLRYFSGGSFGQSCRQNFSFRFFYREYPKGRGERRGKPDTRNLRKRQSDPGEVPVMFSRPLTWSSCLRERIGQYHRDSRSEIYHQLTRVSRLEAEDVVQRDRETSRGLLTLAPEHCRHAGKN